MPQPAAAVVVDGSDAAAVAAVVDAEEEIFAEDASGTGEVVVANELTNDEVAR